MKDLKSRLTSAKTPIIIGIAVVVLLFAFLACNGSGAQIRSLLPVGWLGNEISADEETGFGGAVVTKRGVDMDEIYSETIYMPLGDDTYIHAEAVFPEDAFGGAATKEEIDTDMNAVPLVLMGHGFTGTYNSGGAKELAHRLAEAGFATIRMDFDTKTAPSEKAANTNFYTLESMEEAMKMAADYMCGSYAIDEDAVYLYARSMGGRVAMMMANESYGGYDYKAMALVAPAGNEEAMIYYMGGPETWEKMKKEAGAAGKGYTEKQGQKLVPEWFTQFEEYNPCDFGYKFGEKPVLVIYNTEDNVVTAETSKECAAAYENATEIEVTTEDGHGYEMGYKESELKEQLMSAIVEFFNEARGK